MVKLVEMVFGLGGGEACALLDKSVGSGRSWVGLHISCHEEEEHKKVEGLGDGKDELPFLDMVEDGPGL